MSKSHGLLMHLRHHWTFRAANRGHDSDNSVGERFEAATAIGLKPIFCMGETLEEYNQGLTFTSSEDI
jgi:triosephosphate isomerase